MCHLKNATVQVIKTEYRGRFKAPWTKELHAVESITSLTSCVVLSLLSVFSYGVGRVDSAQLEEMQCLSMTSAVRGVCTQDRTLHQIRQVSAALPHTGALNKGCQIQVLPSTVHHTTNRTICSTISTVSVDHELNFVEQLLESSAMLTPTTHLILLFFSKLDHTRTLGAGE